MLDEWDKLADGEGCPFDNINKDDNAYLIFIKKLNISSLFLDKNQTYCGHCVLIFEPRHITRIDQMTPEEWNAQSNDIYRSEVAIFETFTPDHINVESLGNITPHLHWHIIPRYKSDKRWGGPIWTTTQNEMEGLYLEDNEYEALASEIKQNL